MGQAFVVARSSSVELANLYVKSPDFARKGIDYTAQVQALAS
jgi:hypothetical protein